jgi:hypothetical protein
LWPVGHGDDAVGAASSGSSSGVEIGRRQPRCRYTHFSTLSQVVPEVPPVGDLKSLWGASGGTFGIEGGTVSADDLDAGPLGEPGRQRVCFTVRQKVDRTTRLNVDEHSSVDPTLALGVFVHGDHAGHSDGRVRQRGDQPQQGVPADRYPKDVRHPGAGPARECKTDRDQRRAVARSVGRTLG